MTGHLGDLSWDDSLWDQIWERTLSQVERHTIAATVLRGRAAATVFEWRIAQELARRWARGALVKGAVYLLWTLFWGAIAVHTIGLRGPAAAALPLTCAAVGAIAVLACLGFRARMAATRAAYQAAPPRR
ncbi:MAG TPA: hypothetical protein VM307_11695 [Egibacteraceae bacterium]|nr:hypothetical protein [Egibacteraceae bacterium]